MLIKDLPVVLASPLQSRGLSLWQFFALEPWNLNILILPKNESKFTVCEHMVLSSLGLVLTNWTCLADWVGGTGRAAITAFKHHDLLRHTWEDILFFTGKKINGDSVAIFISKTAELSAEMLPKMRPEASAGISHLHDTWNSHYSGKGWPRGIKMKSEVVKNYDHQYRRKHKGGNGTRKQEIVTSHLDVQDGEAI